MVAPYWGKALDFDMPDKYEALLKFQQDLHADSLFMECLSFEWAHIQDSYLKLKQSPAKRS
jgi:hypothetical protein